MFSKIIGPTAIALLCAALGVVFLLGAIVYSDNIERDISARTQQEMSAPSTVEMSKYTARQPIIWFAPQ